ncbi:hypothetical protein ORIO_16925 [Cereibacter azotoformans]|uniref:Uncharacterized protein n=1 Tax=Cereibacter sphaeroides (strain ATCC 17025 / ATH 2.4.3) TaxID=349102 RepID=A4WXI1_CERS5|nr:hypothetical protein [Cereibacter azotoformans]ULB11550.1 hypothetical protein ORIO_16925 [Cereibacter azotoformans]
MSCPACRIARRGLLSGLPLCVLLWQLGLHEAQGNAALGLALFAAGAFLLLLSLMMRALRTARRQRP